MTIEQYKNAHDDLSFIIALMEPGDRLNGQVCPFCRGGQNEDKSFSITLREDGIALYICHRDKCKRHGVRFADGSFRKIKKRDRPHSVFTSPLHPLSEEDYGVFKRRFNFSPEEVNKANISKTPDDKYCVPIYAPDGHMRGRLIRGFDSKYLRSYKEINCGEEPLIGWYWCPDRKKDIEPYVVVVEDVFSAMKLSRYHNAVTLNGTALSVPAILELLDHSIVQYLILDNDAIKTALNLRNRWKNIMDIRVISCEADPKFWADSALVTLKGAVHGKGLRDS